ADSPAIESDAHRPRRAIRHRRRAAVTAVETLETTPRAFVADASVAIGWIHPGQATADTEAMLDAVADGAAIDVPALWPLEAANALTVPVRRRTLTQGERDAAPGWLRGLPPRIDHEAASLAYTRLSDLATANNLSVYDAPNRD